MHLITAVFCCGNSTGVDSHVRILVRQIGCSDKADKDAQSVLAEEERALQVEAALSIALLNLYDHVSVEWIEVGRYTVLD
jgi:hypothetical protein